VKIREVMSARPIMVSDHEPPADLERLMDAGRVHHLPVVEGGRLVGVWTATDDGPLVLVGPDRVHETQPDVDAAIAVEALLSDAEVVFVWDAGVPAGILTRSDVLAIVRAALGRGIGRRHPRPVVLRLAGPAGAGKTTLLIRTLPLLGRVDTAVVQANVAQAGEAGELAGARAVDEPHAHWRAGLARATERLSDAQLIFVEDRDGPVELAHGIGEDAQVAVIPLADVDEVPDEALRDAQALVVTRVDEVAEDPATRVDAVRERVAGIPVFPVAAGHDDRGLDAWARWVEAQVLSRRG
jgi:Ni2+-binding GTPase involved in maturation of urease and hydrogenase